ncbi:MAG: molybdopterin-guanine dinucleotide biosynthesis protein B [candidate division Zixibacteria bacterium]|nr:molybdopterin-guanine dinucleotide biosynthesis protein B [candidate division Zixibacteria bacterium]
MVKLAIVGAQNSGKTTVIEALIDYLVGKGIRVASIKHTSHRHRFDTPGKDSYRHREAGAGLTVAMSGEEVAVFARPDSLDISLIQDITGEQFDIWLIEGDRTADHPKIVVTRNLKEFGEATPSNLIATIGPEQINESLPHFDTGDYEGLGSFVISTMLDRKTEIIR